MGGNKGTVHASVFQKLKRVGFLVTFIASMAQLIAFQNSAIATEEIKNDFPKELRREERTLITPVGNKDFSLRHRLNHNGENEVIVVLKEARTGLPDSERVLLIGWDVSKDSLYDLWFVPSTEDGELLKHYRVHSKKANGWDVISQFIADGTVSVSNRNYLGMTYQGILGFIYMFAQSYKDANFENFFLTNMQLLREEYKAEDLAATQDYKLAYARYQEAAVGWETMANEAHTARILEWLLPFVDGAVWVTPLGVLSKAAKGSKVVVQTVAKKTAEELAIKLSQTYARIQKASFARIGAKISQIATKAPIVAKVFSVYAKETVGQLSIAELKKLSVAQFRKYLQNRALVESARENMKKAIVASYKTASPAVNTGVNAIKKFLGFSYAQKNYIGFSVGLQMSIEAFMRRKEIYDPNPMIMAKNLFTEREFAQNMYYMTSENILGTGVIGTMGVQSPLKKIAVCGMVSMANANVTGMGMDAVDKVVEFIFRTEGGTEKFAVTESATFQAGMGNPQMLMELSVGDRFEQMAASSGNKKLKFLGFAFAAVDQATGFALYNNKDGIITWAKAKTKEPMDAVMAGASSFGKWFMRQVPGGDYIPADSIMDEVVADDYEYIETEEGEIDLEKLQVILKPVYAMDGV